MSTATFSAIVIATAPTVIATAFTVIAAAFTVIAAAFTVIAATFTVIAAVVVTDLFGSVRERVKAFTRIECKFCIGGGCSFDQLTVRW
jgi:hypothetical protein